MRVSELSLFVWVCWVTLQASLTLTLENPRCRRTYGGLFESSHRQKDAPRCPFAHLTWVARSVTVHVAFRGICTCLERKGIAWRVTWRILRRYAADTWYATEDLLDEWQFQLQTYMPVMSATMSSATNTPETITAPNDLAIIVPGAGEELLGSALIDLTPYRRSERT